MGLFQFTPLEAERLAASPVRDENALRALVVSNGACRGDECRLLLASAGFAAPRELLTGFTYLCSHGESNPGSQLEKLLS